MQTLQNNFVLQTTGTIKTNSPTSPHPFLGKHKRVGEAKTIFDLTDISSRKISNTATLNNRNRNMKYAFYVIPYKRKCI